MCWTDVTWSPHVEFSRYCQVFDACQGQHCLCLFTCYSESQLNCSENCLTQLVCRHTHTQTRAHTHTHTRTHTHTHTHIHTAFPNYPYNPLAPLCLFFCLYLYFFLCWSQHKDFTSDIKSDEFFNNPSDPNSAISFAFIHAEKLTLRMKNGLGSSKYKPAEYKRLQAIVDAKRLESDLIGQKVHFFVINIMLVLKSADLWSNPFLLHVIIWGFSSKWRGVCYNAMT